MLDNCDKKNYFFLSHWVEYFRSTLRDLTPGATYEIQLFTVFLNFLTIINLYGNKLPIIINYYGKKVVHYDGAQVYQNKESQAYISTNFTTKPNTPGR